MPRKLKLHMPRTNNRVRRGTTSKSAVENNAEDLCYASSSSPSFIECSRMNSVKKPILITSQTTEESLSKEMPKLNGLIKATPNLTLAPVSKMVPNAELWPSSTDATINSTTPFTSICINYELGPGHQASVEEHLRDYIAKHPDLAESEAELRPQVEAGVVALKFFRAKYGPEKYGEFVEVMEGFQSKRLDHEGVRRELLAKFGPDEELFQCVNLFLPPSKKFELPTTTATASSSNKQTQTTSSPSEGGEGGVAGSSTGKPSVTTMRAKLTIPMDASVPISGHIPNSVLPISQEEMKPTVPTYNPEKISNILLFLGQVKGYSEELFAATLEIFYKNQNSEVRSKPFLYLRVYEQLMTLYADHPSLKQAYRQLFGPVNVINGNDGSVSIQLPVTPTPIINPNTTNGTALSPEGSFCVKCARSWDTSHDQCTTVPPTKADKTLDAKKVIELAKATQKKLNISSKGKKNKK